MTVREKLLDYKQAQQEILAQINAVDTENVSLAEAGGRVLARDLVAAWDIPRYDNSAMDGFALRSDEATAGAELKIVGTVAAGSQKSFEVTPGCAVRIMTGGVVPPGADAVVPFEQVAIQDEMVTLQRPVRAGEHVRRTGEDMQTGETVLVAGTHLSSLEIGLLATFGEGISGLFRQPKVAILASGNELVPPGEKLEESQIYDSNTSTLCAAVAETGCLPIPLGIARDDHDSLRRLLEEGLQYDLLVTAAGASVGEFDLMRDVLADLEAREIFWGVAIKPGKPTGFCLCREKPVFCLPGNPVSALVTFELFVRPALLKMSGRSQALAETIRLPLAEPMKKKPGRTLFARVRILNTDDGLLVTSAGSQQTGIMTPLVHSDGLAILPDGRGEFARGEKVEVLLLKQK